VVKAVPEPLTVEELVEVVIVPVRLPDIHVLIAFQFPVALDVRVVCPHTPLTTHIFTTTTAVIHFKFRSTFFITKKGFSA